MRDGEIGEAPVEPLRPPLRSRGESATMAARPGATKRDSSLAIDGPRLFQPSIRMRFGPSTGAGCASDGRIHGGRFVRAGVGWRMPSSSAMTTARSPAADHPFHARVDLDGSVVARPISAPSSKAPSASPNVMPASRVGLRRVDFAAFEPRAVRRRRR